MAVICSRASSLTHIFIKKAIHPISKGLHTTNGPIKKRRGNSSAINYDTRVKRKSWHKGYHSYCNR